MEEENSVQVTTQSKPQTQPAGNDVTFPEVSRKKDSKSRFWFYFLFILIVLAITGTLYYLFSKPKLNPEKEEKITPTPLIEIQNTPTQTPELEREDIVIKILNGTGIPGAAALLKEKIEALGYKKIEIGNAKTQDFKITKVTFDKEVLSAVRDEIVIKLTEIYEDVNVSEDDLGRVDIEIITGFTKGYTPTPTVAATSTPTKSLSVTSSPTPTSISSGSL